MPIEITLRFAAPQEVLTLLEIVSLTVDDARGNYQDNGDPGDAGMVADYEELQEALYESFRAVGFHIVGNPALKGGKVFYKGEEVKYNRQPKIEAVLPREDLHA
jgi:hypothetical protein